MRTPAIDEGLLSAIAQIGFPIAIAVYLLSERTQVFKDQAVLMASLNAKWGQMNTLLIEVVKANTASQTQLSGIIQRLYDIIAGGNKIA